MGYMQTSFTWSILFFTNVCKKINCFKVFRLPGVWTWDTKGWHTILCAYIKFLELAYNSMTLHKVPWACMQFHDLVCSCRLRLSSSQEFHSACFSSNWRSRNEIATSLKVNSLRTSEWLQVSLSSLSQLCLVVFEGIP